MASRRAGSRGLLRKRHRGCCAGRWRPRRADLEQCFERLLFRLQPWSRYGVVPLFALANIGVQLDAVLLADTFRSPVTLGLVVAYLVGKPVGTTAGARLATRPAFGGVRRTVTWPALGVGGLTSGVGLTVSLLVVTRAREEPLLDQASSTSPRRGRGMCWRLAASQPAVH